MSRGFDLVNRYGEELEYDFHAFLSLDLCDWFTGRDAPSWGKLIRLAEQLPTHGRFKAAILDDDEYAELAGLPDEDDDDKRSPLDMVDYDPHVRRLSDIADLLIALRATIIAVNSEKGKAPRDIKYTQRPETALDRLKRRHSREKRDLLRSILVSE